MQVKGGLVARKVEHEFHMEWGIRASFVDYVHRLPGGEIGCQDCAVRLEPGASDRGMVWRFPGWRTEGEHGPSIEFGGDVRLRGHGGLLFVMIYRPRLCLFPDRTELSVAELSRWPAIDSYVVIGEAPAFDLDAETADGRQMIVPVALAETGVDIFGGMYEPGAPLDALVLTRGAQLLARDHPQAMSRPQRSERKQ
jgi:hypothetical protein